MRQTVPGVSQGSATTPHPHESLPGTLQIPIAGTEGMRWTGQPSMQVEPVLHPETGAQLASGTPGARLASIVPASGIGRQLHAFGAGS